MHTLPPHLVEAPRHLRERTEATDVRFEGRILRLHVDRVTLPNGRAGEREVVDHPGAVAVLPVTDAGGVVLVWQYRQPARRPLLEIPAGKLDAGEAPERCAHRELLEETGYRAARLERLGTMLPSPGFSGERLHLYIATGLAPGRAEPDPDEFLAVVEATAADVDVLIAQAAIEDLKTFAALSHWRRTSGGMAAPAPS